MFWEELLLCSWANESHAPSETRMSPSETHKEPLTRHSVLVGFSYSFDTDDVISYVA